ncbi:hypothetical protein HMPREF2772_27190 [Achromobacter xylosoxidans]|nr:hypothetical protein HMPREF2772_27190 [Achromobacter xylosoxidans]
MARLLLGRGGGQLGPDALPIIGSEVTAGHDAASHQLNRGAMLYRDRSATGAPLVYERWGDAHMAGKRCRAARIIPVQVAVQVHGRNYSVATV